MTLHLDPKKGVNPYLTYCTRCVTVHGRDPDRLAPKETRAHDGPELVLVGMLGFVDTCKACGMKHYGGAKKKSHAQPYSGSRECVKCGNDKFERRKLGEYERIPSSEPCEECKKEIEEQEAREREVLEAGGIYFTCEDCGVQAMIAGTHEIAKEVREKTGVEAPHPCGVKFTKKECPFCRKEN